MRWFDWVAAGVAATLFVVIGALLRRWRRGLTTIAELEEEPSDPEAVARRAQIDTENVKALLLINGGAAITLLTLLSAVLVAPEGSVAAGRDLIDPLAVGILLCGLGLVSALVHNHLRRRCSMAWEKEEADRGPFLDVYEPKICVWSWIAAFASVVLFIAAGYVVSRAVLLL